MYVKSQREKIWPPWHSERSKFGRINSLQTKNDSNAYDAFRQLKQWVFLGFNINAESFVEFSNEISPTNLYAKREDQECGLHLNVSFKVTIYKIERIS